MKTAAARLADERATIERRIDAAVAVLRAPSMNITDPAVEAIYHVVGEYKVHFTGLNIPVCFRIFEDLSAQAPQYKFRFEQSHYFHGPDQAGPYVTSANYADTPENALRRGIETILDHYKPAIGKHLPRDSWLIPDPQY